VESTFILHGSKNAQLLSPPEFLSSPPSEVGLTQNPGDSRGKILTTDQFLFFKVILENILKNSVVHFVVPSHFTLHPKAVKLKGWLLKNEP
jgi:hypothetical protein